MALVDAEFPDYRQVIPKQGKVAVSLVREELPRRARVRLGDRERARAGREAHAS